MSQSRTQALAESVMTYLNSKKWDGIDLRAKRKYVVLEGLTGFRDFGDHLRVSVVCREEPFVALTRSSWESKPLVDIGVQKKLRNKDPETIDPLTKLVELIRDDLASANGVFRAQVAALNWGLIQASIEPIAAWEHLVEPGVFTSVITLGFHRQVSL